MTDRLELLKSVGTETVRGSVGAELSALHEHVHGLFAELQAGDVPLAKQIVRVHTLVADELAERDLEHGEDGKLDELAWLARSTVDQVLELVGRAGHDDDGDLPSGRVSKEAAEYKDASSVQRTADVRCFSCRYLQQDTNEDGETHTCALVEGEIDADSVCELWTRGSADATQVGKELYDLALMKAQTDEDKQYTFGVMYKATEDKDDPELDAHDEFVMADLLQEAQWNYVKRGDRGIYLQHGFLGFKQIGEWVDIVAWPYEVEVELVLPGRAAKKTTIPANSVWMGVLWTDEGWKQVRAGKIRGFSMGGMASREQKKS